MLVLVPVISLKLDFYLNFHHVLLVLQQQDQPLRRHLPAQMSRGFSQSTSVLSGTELKPRKFDGNSDVDLIIKWFEQVSDVHSWDE